MTGYSNAPIIIQTDGWTAGEGTYFPCKTMSMTSGTTKLGDLNGECGSGKYIRFNLSAVAKGLLYSQNINPGSAVPTAEINYVIKNRKFMKDSGENFDTVGSESGSVTVYLGRGDALARFRGAESTAVSYKPTDTEVVNTGDYYVTRGQTDAVSAKVAATNTDVYIEDNPLRHQIIFLNSFGRWESASALTRESKSFKYESSDITLDANFPDNIDRPNRITHRQLSEVVWSMSSGYVTKTWAEWWAKEVLAAEFVWLREGSTLIPVILEPNDSTTVWNKAKGNLCHVEFKVKFK